MASTDTKKETGRMINSIRNSFFGLINKLVALLFPFIIRTIIIYTLGSEYLGLSSLFNSLLSMLSMAELGVGSAIVYSMYKPIATKSNDEICALLNLYKWIYRIIGGIVLAIGMVLLPFLRFLIKGDIPADVNLYLLFFVYLSNTVSSYLLFAYKTSILTASQRSDILSAINTICQLTMYILQVVMLLFTKNYYAYIIFLPLSTVVNNLIVAQIVNKKYPAYKPKGMPQLATINEIKKNVFALMGHKVGGIILNSCSNLFISANIGLVALAMYNNYYFVLSAVMGILNMFYISITAGIGNSLITEGPEKNYKTFKTLTFLNAWITSWGTVCMLCLFQHFMKVWVGEQMRYSLETVILFSVYFFVWNIRKIVLTYKDAAGMWMSDIMKPYVSIVLVLALNLLLIGRLGINGVLIATIITMVLVNIPWETYVTFKELLNRSAWEYYKMLLTFAAATVLCSISCYMVTNLIAEDNFIQLLLKGVICCILPNCIWFALFMKTEEMRDLLAIIKLFRKRKV